MLFVTISTYAEFFDHYYESRNVLRLRKKGKQISYYHWLWQLLYKTLNEKVILALWQTKGRSNKVAKSCTDTKNVNCQSLIYCLNDRNAIIPNVGSSSVISDIAIAQSAIIILSLSINK